MVVVTTGRDERGLVAVTLHLLEAEDVAVEPERTVDVAHLQMNVADVHAWIDRHAIERSVFRQAGVGISLASDRASLSSTPVSCA